MSLTTKQIDELRAYAKDRKGELAKLINDAADTIEVLSAKQSEPKWIPVSERLPEENGEYLVTREAKGIYKYVDIVKKTNVSGDIASDIVAWMPLPEPYREEGENE